jgi:hypothetical protein
MDQKFPIPCSCVRGSFTQRLRAKPGLFLVLVPATLKKQWTEEYYKFVDDTTLKTKLIVRHGTKDRIYDEDGNQTDVRYIQQGYSKLHPRGWSDVKTCSTIDVVQEDKNAWLSRSPWRIYHGQNYVLRMTGTEYSDGHLDI